MTGKWGGMARIESDTHQQGAGFLSPAGKSKQNPIQNNSMRKKPNKS